MKRQRFLPLVFALILLVSGATTLFTLWASSFSDYMAIEDLGLDISLAPEAFAELTSLSGGERYLAAWAVGSFALGLLVLMLSLVLGALVQRSKKVSK